MTYSGAILWELEWLSNLGTFRRPLEPGQTRKSSPWKNFAAGLP
jgi:hypothetical protein